jgi:hypothetical protein
VSIAATRKEELRGIVGIRPRKVWCISSRSVLCEGKETAADIPSKSQIPQ